jgi:hypothetical protein
MFIELMRHRPSLKDRQRQRQVPAAVRREALVDPVVVQCSLLAELEVEVRRQRVPPWGPGRKVDHQAERPVKKDSI